MIDLSTQAINIGIDPKSLKKLYDVFVSSTRNDLLEMRKAYASNNYEKFKLDNNNKETVIVLGCGACCIVIIYI